MNYYLIRWNNEKTIVQAKNGLGAATKWFDVESEQRKSEGIRVKFNPTNFTVEEIGREILVAE